MSGTPSGELSLSASNISAGPLWKRVMNRRVKAWRKRHYPDINDWHAYNKALNPVADTSASVAAATAR